jgi:hypothetical protein
VDLRGEVVANLAVLVECWLPPIVAVVQSVQRGNWKEISDDVSALDRDKVLVRLPGVWAAPPTLLAKTKMKRFLAEDVSSDAVVGLKIQISGLIDLEVVVLAEF